MKATDLAPVLDRYLAVRDALGFSTHAVRPLLHEFLHFLETTLPPGPQVLCLPMSCSYGPVETLSLAPSPVKPHGYGPRGDFSRMPRRRFQRLTSRRTAYWPVHGDPIPISSRQRNSPLSLRRPRTCPFARPSRPLRIKRLWDSWQAPAYAWVKRCGWRGRTCAWRLICPISTSVTPNFASLVSYHSIPLR